MNALQAMAKGLDKTPKPIISKTTQAILDSIEKNRITFLTGKGGTGKSYQIASITNLVKGTLVLATTGIAAINIDGETLHSALCIDILENMEQLLESDKLNRMSKRFQEMEETLFNTRLIIIDEISMLNREQLEMVLYRVSEFPQIKLLLVGDFKQLPPVTGRPLYVSRIFTEQVNVLKLTKNHRQSSDLEFQEVLEEVRSGTPSEKALSILKGQEQNIVEGAIKLRARNDQVHEINHEELDKLDSELFINNRTITFKNRAVDRYVIAGLLGNTMEPEEFQYKLNARVMITKNDKQKGIFNGDLATISNIDIVNNTLTLKLDRRELPVVMKPYEFDIKVTLSGRKVTAVKYSQFPLKLAYATTIHKVQGLSLDKIDIDCDGIFATEQFYVALSRARTLKGVQTHNIDKLTFRKNRRLKSKFTTK